MSDYIMRSDVLTLVDKGYLISNSNYEKERKLINKLPSANVIGVSKILKTADEQEKQGFIQTAKVLRELVK